MRIGGNPVRIWQATDIERRMSLIGDGLVPGAASCATHAVTIRASAAAVWPWLVQMGCGRAGWYSYDLLDNGGVPSAEAILPEFQHTRAGDVMPSRPGGSEGFEVLRLEAPHVMVLGAHFRLPRAEALPWRSPSPEAYLRSTWAFVLREQGSATRLVVRVKGIWQPRWAERLAGAIMTPTHTVMQRRQLLNLKARAERRIASEPVPTPVGAPAFGAMWV